MYAKLIARYSIAMAIAHLAAAVCLVSLIADRMVENQMIRAQSACAAKSAG